MGPARANVRYMWRRCGATACSALGDTMVLIDVNDCWEFDFGKRAWSTVRPSSGTPPSPRDRHVAVVWGGSFYVVCGFDGRLA